MLQVIQDVQPLLSIQAPAYVLVGLTDGESIIDTRAISPNDLPRLNASIRSLHGLEGLWWEVMPPVPITPSLKIPMIQTSLQEVEDTLPVLFTSQTMSRVVLFYMGKRQVVDICQESAVAVLRAMIADQAIETAEGYEDDPTAMFYILKPNQYVKLLNYAERTAVYGFYYRCRDEVRQPRRSVHRGGIKRRHADY